jgi:hypothetical protein
MGARHYHRASGLRVLHAQSLAAQQRLDHSGFRQRVDVSSGPAAENVAYGCATEDRVIRMWARSGAHRANMLRRCVTQLGSRLGGRDKWQALLGAGTRQLIQR